MLLQSTPAISTVFAADNTNINNTQIDNNNNHISNFITYQLVNKTLDSKKGHQSKFFYMDSDLKYAKIWVKNDSEHFYNVTVTEDTPGGQELYYFSVPKGDYNYIIRDFEPDSIYYVNVSSNNSYPLKGQLSVRGASSISELVK